MYKVILNLDKFFLKYEEGGDGDEGGRGGQIDQIDPLPGRTTFKKPSLIRVKLIIIIINLYHINILNYRTLLFFDEQSVYIISS